MKLIEKNIFRKNKHIIEQIDVLLELERSIRLQNKLNIFNKIFVLLNKCTAHVQFS